MLLLEGSSGLGKSGLIAAIRRLAEESGARTMSAAGRRLESEFSFGVVLQLFESGGWNGKGPSGFDPASLPATRPEEFFNGIHRVYRAYADVAQESPLVVLIDDADLADSESLRVLLYLAERIADLPIALILTAGRVPAGRAPALLAELARHQSCSLSRLQPLTEQGHGPAAREDHAVGLRARCRCGDPPRRRRQPLRDRRVGPRAGEGRGGERPRSFQGSGRQPRVPGHRRMGVGTRGRHRPRRTGSAQGRRGARPRRRAAARLRAGGARTGAGRQARGPAHRRGPAHAG